MENNKSQELIALEKAINTYIQKHKGDCIINISVSGFDEDGEVIDDQVWLWGEKELLKIENKCMKKYIDEL